VSHAASEPVAFACTDCLANDRELLLVFYDFSAEHSKQPRTTNPIESIFATAQQRTIRAKGCLSDETALAVVYKLVEAAQRSWRHLYGRTQLLMHIQGVNLNDGIEAAAPTAMPQARTAAWRLGPSPTFAQCSLRTGGEDPNCRAAGPQCAKV
jgi:hypothetical protein